MECGVFPPLLFFPPDKKPEKQKRWKSTALHMKTKLFQIPETGLGSFTPDE
jgi:hypothetical protein